MSFKVSIGALFLTVAATVSSGLFAQQISYNFSGFVSNPGSGEILGVQIGLGDDVFGTFRYDLNSKNSSDFMGVGSFAQDIANGFTLSINGVQISANTYDVVITTISLGVQNIEIQEVPALVSMEFNNFSDEVFEEIELPDESLSELDFENLIGFVDLDPFFQNAILFSLEELSSVPDILLGDVNLDGTVDLLDVVPFIDLLVDSGFQAEADFDEDGVISLLDITPFVAAIAG